MVENEEGAKLRILPVGVSLGVKVKKTRKGFPDSHQELKRINIK